MSLQVTFTEMDVHYPYLDSPARKMASFLFNHQIFIETFFMLTRSSPSWNTTEYISNLKKWLTHYKKMNMIFNKDDVDTFFCLVKNLFYARRYDCELPKVRGLVPEKLLELIFNQYPANTWNVSLGCEVSINGQPVIYNNTHGDGKKTVDVGAWSERLVSGKFLEIKLSPNSFNDKDAYYLRKLDTELNSIRKIKKIIYVVTFESTALTKRQVDRKRDSLDISTNIKVIGRDTIFTEFCQAPPSLPA